ncbi:PliI family lysozyme inhibitor of I-type lysozyme [Flavobacterium sp. RSSB_23]|uniref:PliI family lysozyme inhibitor of I-type lysozyme n=1 Tax=Flavobacterium sp. RSSB_23 TaxID=3447668 RepID=UPI003F3FCAF7
MKKNILTSLVVSLTLLSISCQKKSETTTSSESNQTKDSTTTSISKPEEQKADYTKKVTYKDISFAIAVTGSNLTIQPKGFSEDNSIITKTIDGSINNVEVDDVNADGSPELLIYVTSAGSGSYGTAIGFSGNNNKSLSEIAIPSIIDNPKANKGYMGHDEFALVEGTLVQRFPIYKEGDTNSKPTGGTRQIQYKLKNGEASKVFAIDKIIEY